MQTVFKLPVKYLPWSSSLGYACDAMDSLNLSCSILWIGVYASSLILAMIHAGSCACMHIRRSIEQILIGSFCLYFFIVWSLNTTKNGGLCLDGCPILSPLCSVSLVYNSVRYHLACVWPREVAQTGRWWLVSHRIRCDQRASQATNRDGKSLVKWISCLAQHAEEFHITSPLVIFHPVQMHYILCSHLKESVQRSVEVVEYAQWPTVSPDLKSISVQPSPRRHGQINVLPCIDCERHSQTCCLPAKYGLPEMIPNMTKVRSPVRLSRSSEVPSKKEHGNEMPSKNSWADRNWKRQWHGLPYSTQ